MTQVTLPYLLADGQKAYAARVMADLNALMDGINALAARPLNTNWYTGNGISGTSATAAVFPDSGVAAAQSGDMYYDEVARIPIVRKAE